MKKLLWLALFISPLAMAVKPFELPLMNGASGIPSTYKSADHTNGVFVVEAYFRTCPYCNFNAPSVDAMAEKYENEPRVQVLDVGVDRNDSDYQMWIDKHHPNHPVLKDAKRQLIGQLGTVGYPSTYVIDCKGKLVAQTEGQWDSDLESQIQAGIDEALKANCQPLTRD